MKQANPNESEHVELPKSLKTNATRNYSPQTSHLEGFAQMPRQFASPYQNGKLVLKQDLVRRKRSQHTSKFFETAALTLGAPSPEGGSTSVDNRSGRNSNRQSHSTSVNASLDHGRIGMQLITDAWNRDYTKKLAAKGPASLRALNLGTSFLVAPMN